MCTLVRLESLPEAAIVVVIEESESTAKFVHHFPLDDVKASVTHSAVKEQQR